MSAAFTDVFRSARQPDCEERAFMLSAVGIASTVDFDGMQYVVMVDQADALRASLQLERYEIERRAPAPAAAAPPIYAHAWIGCVGYCVVLIAIGLIISNGWWRLDAFNTGELDAAQVQSGQWWRAWTALTLHLDGGHLAANLAAGCWFGYLAARQIGAGNAWLLIVSAAACANLIEGLLGPPSHRSVGASTAVFAALGLLSAHSWRLQYSRAQRWALRWAPLVGGVVLLGWFGAGDENTDSVAHVLGFVIGVLMGALIAQRWAQQQLARVPQWLGGLLAVFCVAAAWACALAS